MLDLIQEIEKADEVALGELLKAVLRRYAVLRPDLDVSAICLQKSADKNEQLDRTISFLQGMKNLNI